MNNFKNVCKREGSKKSETVTRWNYEVMEKFFPSVFQDGRFRIYQKDVKNVPEEEKLLLQDKENIVP